MSSLTIISVILVVACVAPFVWISVNGRRKRQAVVDRLRQACASYQFKDEGCSVWDDAILAVDTNREVICFQKGMSPVVVHPLASITGCSVSQQHNTEGGGALAKVDLCLFLGKSKNEVRIPFFDARERLDLNNELMLAMEWKSRTESLLKAK